MEKVNYRNKVEYKSEYCGCHYKMCEIKFQTICCKNGCRGRLDYS